MNAAEQPTEADLLVRNMSDVQRVSKGMTATGKSVVVAVAVLFGSRLIAAVIDRAALGRGK